MQHRAAEDNWCPCADITKSKLMGYEVNSCAVIANVFMHRTVPYSRASSSFLPSSLSSKHVPLVIHFGGYFTPRML